MASSSQNQQSTAVKGGVGTTSTPANSNSSAPKSTSFDAGERRRSAEGAGMFSNLSNLKRGSQDQNTAARKESFAEQKAQPGVLGQMWHSWTKGQGN